MTYAPREPPPSPTPKIWRPFGAISQGGINLDLQVVQLYVRVSELSLDALEFHLCQYGTFGFNCPIQIWLSEC
jgi:hypothetical protein